VDRVSLEVLERVAGKVEVVEAQRPVIEREEAAQAWER
jgi:hypothetical protein